MVQWIRAARSCVVLCLSVAVVGLSVPAAATAAVSVQSVSLWKQNAAPVAWSANPDLVYYNAVGPDGMYEGYNANPDGSNPTCVTCSAPSFAGVGAATQRGVSDVSSDGKYMLLEVESPNHLGPVGEAISEPGKGAYANVWLASTDGTQEWQLTNVTAPGSGLIGTMWARFSPSGNQIVFAEMYGAAQGNLGYWQLVVATIGWTNGTPSLTDETVINPAPNHFMEPYGFTPDGSKVIFASDIDQPSWMDSQIWEIGTDGSNLTHLSPDAPYGVFTDYNEFAFDLPSGNGIVYGSTDDSSTDGVDYWLMDPDGTNPQRLTYFNQPWSTENKGSTTVGSLAFNPDNPDQFLAAVTHSVGGQDQTAVLITLSDASNPGGLAAHYYSNSTTFQGSPETAINNPSSGFQWAGSPMPGISPSNYSVQWTGSIIPPATGTYTFCLIADGGGELYLGGTLVINGASALGQRVCGTAQGVAGQPLGVTLDYAHEQGDGYEQLTWIPPGDSPQLSAVEGGLPVDWTGTPAAGDIIPTSALSPNGSGTPPPAPSAPVTTIVPHSTGTAGKPSTKKTKKPAVAVIARARHHKKSKKRRHKKAKKKTKKHKQATSKRKPAKQPAHRGR